MATAAVTLTRTSEEEEKVKLVAEFTQLQPEEACNLLRSSGWVVEDAITKGISCQASGPSSVEFPLPPSPLAATTAELIGPQLPSTLIIDDPAQQEDDDLTKAIQNSLEQNHAPDIIDLCNPLERQRSAGVPSGLWNLGNTCYVNSILQLYFSIPPFRRLILSLGLSETLHINGHAATYAPQPANLLPTMGSNGPALHDPSGGPSVPAQAAPAPPPLRTTVSAVHTASPLQLRQIMRSLQRLFAFLDSSKSKDQTPRGLIELLFAHCGTHGFKIGFQGDVLEFAGFFFDFLEQAAHALKNTPPDPSQQAENKRRRVSTGDAIVAEVAAEMAQLDSAMSLPDLDDTQAYDLDMDTQPTEATAEVADDNLASGVSGTSIWPPPPPLMLASDPDPEMAHNGRPWGGPKSAASPESRKRKRYEAPDAAAATGGASDSASHGNHANHQGPSTGETALTDHHQLLEAIRLFKGAWSIECTAEEADGEPVTSKSEEEFDWISLDIENRVSLHDSLDAFTSPSKIEEYCTPKGHTTTGDRQYWFKGLPPVLAFQQKRVVYNSTSKSLHKLNTTFSFEPELYLDRYLWEHRELRAELLERREKYTARLASIRQELDRYQAANGVSYQDGLGATLEFLRLSADPDVEASLTACTALLQQQLDEVSHVITELESEAAGLEAQRQALFLTPELTQHRYALHAVVMHEGQARGGHYYLYCRDAATEQWFRYNDREVTPVLIDTVIREATGAEGSTRNASAMVYVLPSVYDSEPCEAPADLMRLVEDQNRALDAECAVWLESRVTTAQGAACLLSLQSSTNGLNDS